MRTHVRGGYPDPAFQPGDRHGLKGARCLVRGRAPGRISHAYWHDTLGLRCYVVLDNRQAGWFLIADVAHDNNRLEVRPPELAPR